MMAKRYIIAMAVAMGAAGLASAQNTYVNAEMTQDHDLQGSARYVAMGGAFSALGAEASAMGDNPAATALMRKSEITLTAGALWGADKSGIDLDNGYSYGRTHFTFDQAAIVGAFKVDGRYIKNFNIGFNYHKKINFNNLNAGEIACSGSQLNQYADLLNNYGTDIYNRHSDGYIYGAYYDCGLIDYGYAPDGSVNWSRSSKLPATTGQSMYRMTKGAMHAYDFNLSVNVKDRYYVGLTIGVDYLNYSCENSYAERIGTDDAPYDFDIANYHKVTGSGFNFKLGTIIRPIEDNPLRIGVAVESPTWFLLSSHYDNTLRSKYDANIDDFVPVPGEFYSSCYSYYNMEYSIRTPWRFRLAVGSTVSNKLAWGVDYEYAIYKYEGMGYLAEDERRSIFNTIDDEMMNANTRHSLSGQHRVKFGLEYKPISRLSLRAGYNYICDIYKSERWDPGVADESTVNNIGTSWITVSPTHLLTFGLGTRIKWFGVDLAYKCRLQNASYYGNLDSYPSSIDMNTRRHSVICTLSARF
ncbi:MAG: hypothetical protein J6035_02795 [Bacteroidaceae bacterium]|nr:hypothetical protein [Bacteroidaceae bacterium]